MGMVWMAYRLDSAAAAELLADPERLEDLLEFDEDEDETSVDLDKAWHGLHWLFTGSTEATAETASLAIFGGEPFGEDMGYGPARLLHADGVRAVNDFLAGIDLAALRERMAPSDMASAGVYPDIWEDDDVFDTYLEPALQNLRDFYEAAAAANEVVIQTLG